MDHTEICGKHIFNDAKTRTKNTVNRQTQLQNTCDVTDLIPNWTFVTKCLQPKWKKRVAFPIPSHGVRKWLTSQRWMWLYMPNFHLPSSVISILFATCSRLLHLLATRFWSVLDARWWCIGPGVSVYGVIWTVMWMSCLIMQVMIGKRSRIQYFVTNVQMLR